MATDIFPVLLGSWPTPLEPAPRLGAALGLAAGALWIKRDDLTGLGGGGNKVRKLQYTCAEAVAAGATTLVTTGAPQSNHARLTAAAAARLGLACVLVLRGAEPAARQGNVVLDHLAGARIVWTGDAAPGDRVEQVVREIRDGGGVPHVIPLGGSSPVGALGYADCGIELLAQLPDLDHVVVSLGSGGTMAGLVASLGADRVIGVDTGALPDPGATVADLVAGMSEAPAQPGNPGRDGKLRIDGAHVGAGYASLTSSARAAMLLAARTEGIFLDPVYTARAMAGLIAAAADGRVAPGDRTVFLHTGGLPGMFGHHALDELT